MLSVDYLNGMPLQSCYLMVALARSSAVDHVHVDVMDS